MVFKDLFNNELKVINIGLTSFTQDIKKLNKEVIHVDWSPPAGGDIKMARLNNKLTAMTQIDSANEKALRIILSGKPVLVSLEKAVDVIPGMKKNMFLHAGPPIGWERMCGPMRGAVIGALIYEGFTSDVEEARLIASSDDIEYSPCHQHSTVGPMAGIVSASMPVFVLENKEYGNRAFCTMNEGLGKVLRYGAYSSEVISKLKWMDNVLYPSLKKAVKVLGEIDLKNIIAQALHMGDEVHNRNRAATSLFYRTIAPSVIKTAEDPNIAAQVLEFINGNDHFFLNLSMPACKVTLDAARNIESSSIVIAMTRNGTDFGLQLSGTFDEWFTGPAPKPDALFFPGYTKDDANPDIGDSSITEVNGLGGFAIAASPAIVQFVGGNANDAVNYTLEMYEITAGENTAYQIPYLNFRGSPTGIDVRKVIDKNTTPFIDTGVAHKDPGVGQVGAGVLKAPMEPFKHALKGLANRLKIK